ncbi:response regulator [Belnapia moabensis]|uniref:response regulator n=1 Tax=Belnapia moabensis TaxID=365533 RepID=UPI0005BD91BA|nr:response regulator [Belnapia moabensis]
MPSVMLVDDDELLRDLLQLRLEVEGWDVRTAPDGAAAIAALAQGGAGVRPDAVLLDLLMPVMDGMRFMRHLAEDLPDPPPVVVLSAIDKPEIRRDLLAAGVREVVRKPVELPVLLAALRAATGA